MKRLLQNTLFISIIIIFGCEKYEFVDKNTRFNKRTGETEVLYGEGKWMTKLQRIKYDEKLIEKERQERESKILPFPYEEQKKVTGNGGFIQPYKHSQPDRYEFETTIENNSDWRIEEIQIQVRIYSKSDNSLLVTRKLKSFNYDKNEGTPFSKTVYSSEIPKLLENQYSQWSIDECRGYKY